MRRTHVSFIIFSGFLLLLTNSCQTLVSTPTLPTAQLGTLIELKNKAEADGMFLKDSMREKPEKSMGESIKEMIGAGKKPKTTNLAASRVKYNDVAASCNAAITIIQQSLKIGKNPAEYADALDEKIEEVRKKQARLARYTKKTFGASRGLEDILESKEAEVLVATVQKVWNARKKEIQKERQQAIDALEDEKMLSFADL